MCYFYLFAKKKLEENKISYAFLLVFTAPVICLGTLLTIPDVLSVPLGLATIYFLDQGKTRTGAFFLGLGFLSKWSIMGLIPFFIYSCWKRSKKELAICGLIVFSLQIPVLIWNSHHEWATFYFQFFKRHSTEFLTFEQYFHNLRRYIGSQLFCFGIPLMLGSVIAFFKASRDQKKFFSLLVFPMFAISFFSALQGQNRYYWSCLNMFTMSIFIVQVFSKQLELKSKYVWCTLVCFIFINWSLILVGTFFPVGSWFDRVTHQQNQFRHNIAGDVSGWKTWVEVVHQEKIDVDHMSILASDFHIAAQITWALGPDYVDRVRPVGTAWEQHQFGFWPQRQLASSEETLLVADDRYDNLADLQNVCDETINWNRQEEKLFGQTIKVIYWSVCHKRKEKISLL